MFDADIAFDPYDTGPIGRLVAAWLPLAQAVNGINRCMGQPDLYPFVLTEAVAEKMAFIHDLVHADQDRRHAPEAGQTDAVPIGADTPMASAG
jgi:hypothetical protein